MNWPKRITFIIEDEISHKPIPNIVLLVVLVALQKNNYSIAYLMTDKDGKVSLSFSEISLEVARLQKEYPMDYSDEVKECKEVMVKIKSMRALRLRAKAMAELYSADAASLESLLSNANNDKIKPLSKKFVVSEKIVVGVGTLQHKPVSSQ